MDLMIKAEKENKYRNMRIAEVFLRFGLYRKSSVEHEN